MWYAMRRSAWSRCQVSLPGAARRISIGRLRRRRVWSAQANAAGVMRLRHAESDAGGHRRYLVPRRARSVAGVLPEVNPTVARVPSLLAQYLVITTNAEALTPGSFADLQAYPAVAPTNEGSRSPDPDFSIAAPEAQRLGCVRQRTTSCRSAPLFGASGEGRGRAWPGIVHRFIVA